MTLQFPISYAQERFWIMDQLDPGNAAYNISGAIGIRGELDVESAQNAIREIINRHQPLRSHFAPGPLQSIGPLCDRQIRIVDIREQHPSVRDDQRQTICAQERQRRFDLSKGPLFFATILRENDYLSSVVISVHHSIFDGWSVGVFIREFVELYDAFSKGRTSPLKPLPIQYGEYAEWQRGQSQSIEMKRQLEYWRTQLNGLENIEMPADFRRPSQANYAGRSIRITLNESVAEALGNLSSRVGVTPFIIFSAALKVLLHRYTGQTDIAIGAPVANRRSSDTEALIGLFVNTLVLRTNLSGNPTFNQLLLRERQVVLEAHENQDAPFDLVVQSGCHTRVPGLNPLFQVLLSFENAPGEALNACGLEFEFHTCETEVSKFDLSLAVKHRGATFEFEFEYSSALYKDETIGRLAGQWRTLLDSIARHPANSIDDLSISDSKERRHLLLQWSRCPAHFTGPTNVAELFETQASKTPELPAVSGPAGQLSYLELNSLANAIAGELLKLGAVPDEPVAILLDRSHNLIASLLGCLKAGAPYVMLEPEWPSNRIGYILADTKARIVITNTQFLASFDIQGRSILSMEDIQWGTMSKDNIRPSPGPSPENLAYIAYTSGSTGKPKGAMIPHRAMVNYVHSAIACYNLSANDRVLQFSPLASDPMVMEVFPILVCGGAVVLRSEAMIASPAAFFSFCAQWRVSAISLPTSYWAILANSPEISQLASNSIRLAIIAGERADPQLLHCWLQAVHSKVTLMNVYGPTETTVEVTRFIAPPDFSPISKEVPIGAPLSNSSVYVLDQRLELAPAGASGELFIGGENVARGYLGQPELTAERFVPDPFSNRPGCRLYRTGDLARWNSNGQLEFLGRVDNQIKIRGYRVEAGEVEATIMRQPQIQLAAVTAHEIAPGEKRLAAYIALKPGHAICKDQLRADLRAILPDYMVPAAFMIMDSLPLTPTGKIDRRALPPPTWSLSHAPASVPPRTPLEEQIAQVWERVFNISPVGAMDNFFERGGHSLHAIQIASELGKQTGLELTLRDVFANPVLADLANVLKTRSTKSDRCERRAKAENDTTELDASWPQRLMWERYVRESGNKLYHISFRFTLSGNISREALSACLEELFRRHEILRTTYHKERGRLVQKIRSDSRPRITWVDLSSAQPPDQEQKLAEFSARDVAEVFDLSAFPLWRLTAFALSANQLALICTMHHITVDGWSLNVLAEEAMSIYSTLMRGEAPTVERPVQYADFVHWQETQLPRDEVRRQLQFWKQELFDAPATLELPFTVARPVASTYRGKTVGFSLDSDETARLRQLSQTACVSIPMILTTAFVLLLARECKQEDIVIGYVTSMRNRIEFSRVIGFFANTWPLRIRLESAHTYLEAAQAVARTILDAAENQDVHLYHICSEIFPGRDIIQEPLFRFVFNFNHQGSPPPLHFDGLRVERSSNATGSARHDIAVFAQDTGASISITFRYNPDIIEAAQASELLALMKAHLEAICSNSSRPWKASTTSLAEQNMEIAGTAI